MNFKLIACCYSECFYNHFSKFHGHFDKSKSTNESVRIMDLEFFARPLTAPFNTMRIHKIQSSTDIR